MTRLWQTYTAAPHRVLFLPGAMQALLAMLWWLADLEARMGSVAMLPESVLPSPAAHAWLMLHGVFPFFIFGFLFTAMPNWLNGPAIQRPAYLATGLGLAAGTLLFYAGLYLPALAPLALCLHAAGWATGLLALMRTLRHAPPGDKLHGWLAWSACLLGLLGDLAFLAWLEGAPAGLLAVSGALGLWGCLAPVFLTVCHRMVPWFTSRVVQDYVMIRPNGALWALLAACLTHAGLEVAGLFHWTWLADLPLAGLAFWFSLRWDFRRGMTVRLLAMLHIAFLWAGTAFLLYGLDSLALFLNAPRGLGYAPLHALGIGFFGSMLIGMASRVSLGHSGRKLEADGFTWALFWLVQATAVVRMLPDLLPAELPYRLASLAALLWLLAFGLWAARYAPWYWQPRSDGKPG